MPFVLGICTHYLDICNEGTSQYSWVLASEGWWETWQPSAKVTRRLVKDKVGRPPDELGISKSMECGFFPLVLWNCWLSDRKSIWPVKNWVLVCWWWWFDWSFARLIALVITTTSIILCFSKHRLTQVHLENGRQNGGRGYKSVLTPCSWK